jgi:hypothetical protein
MPPVGFEPLIPASARPQTYALDRAATGIGVITTVRRENRINLNKCNFIFYCILKWLLLPRLQRGYVFARCPTMK